MILEIVLTAVMSTHTVSVDRLRAEKASGIKKERRETLKERRARQCGYDLKSCRFDEIDSKFRMKGR